MNHKKVYRLYREEGLKIRRKKRKRVALVPREPKPVPEAPDQRWSMDFVTDQLADGRYFRVFTVVDQFSRECVALHAPVSIRSKDVGEVVVMAGGSSVDQLRVGLTLRVAD